MAKVVHSLGLYIFIDAILICGFLIIPYEQISWKILALFLLCTALIATVLYIAVQTYLALTFTWEEMATQYRADSEIAIERMLPGAKAILDLWQPLLFFLLAFVQQKFKRLDKSKSDLLNDKNIFIVFVYPKSIIGLFLVVFWRYPVSTIKLYHNGLIYGFNKEDGFLSRRMMNFTERNSGSYFFKNTKLTQACYPDLYNLLNTNWTLRTNCLNVFEPVIGKLRSYI